MLQRETKLIIRCKNGRKRLVVDCVVDAIICEFMG